MSTRHEAAASSPLRRSRRIENGRGLRFSPSLDGLAYLDASPAVDSDLGDHTGLSSSSRHVGPPGNSASSALTKAGASPPRTQTCESGGTLPRNDATAPATPGTCTFTT